MATRKKHTPEQVVRKLASATLKRLLADAELEKAALREISQESSEPGTAGGGRAPPDEDDEGE